MKNNRQWNLLHQYICQTWASWILPLLLLLLALPARAQTNPPPGTLAVVEISQLGAGCPEIVDSLRFTFGYCPDGTLTRGLFSGLLLTTNDIGRIFPVTQAEDTNFDFIVSILTNGTPDWVGDSIEIPPCGYGEATLEQNYFAPLPTGGNGIDFAGFHIDNLALQIDGLTFTHDPRIPRTDLTWNFKLFVNSVPWARPSIVTPPQNQMAAVGATVHFTVSASGDPPLGYQWFFNGTNRLSGGTNTVLELVNVQPAQEGRYTVVVTNRFGAVTSSPAILTLTPRPPTILASPQSQTAAMGSTVRFVVSADGAPPPDYQWYFYGTNSLNAATNSVLELVNVQPAQAGPYTVVVSNAVGAVTSPPATLTVLNPAIASQPVSQLVLLGQPATLSVQGAGTAPLGYQWFKDGARLSDGGNISGAQSPTLSLAIVLGPDAGGYWVVVTNVWGSATSAVAAINIASASYSVLHHFTGVDGSYSCSALVAADSTLYGATVEGGALAGGTVFKLRTDGSAYTVLRSLNGVPDGNGPIGDLLLSGTTLYGTTYMGGTLGYGTVFKLGTDGTGFTVLHPFEHYGGGEPETGLVRSGSTLYGATAFTPVLFKVNTDGSGYALLRRFTVDDGYGPSGSGSLVLSGTNLYGTTGGAGFQYPFGTVFKVSTDGSDYVVLKSFAGDDGSWPYGGLLLSGTTLYGATAEGGAADGGTVFKINTDGTGFTVLKHFTGSDGLNPNGGLVLAGNTLYGTTDAGGASDLGTVFQVNTDGSFSAVLKSFTGGDGSHPRARLTWSGGTLYGTTAYGGNSNGGVVFALSLLYFPTIQVPPTSQTAELGARVVFHVTATGQPEPAYQWFFNGTNSLGMATTNAFLSLTNVQAAQAGAYTVVVTNALGAATSAPALLNVVPVVERRLVPGLALMGAPGSLLNLDATDNLAPAPNWTRLDSVLLTAASQWYFDLTAPFPPQRYYRTWQPGPAAVIPALDLHTVPAITLSGVIGTEVRLDYINQFGPIDAWVNLATVTLTNTTQLYFDTSAIGQPPRLWRIVPVP